MKQTATKADTADTTPAAPPAMLTATVTAEVVKIGAAICYRGASVRVTEAQAEALNKAFPGCLKVTGVA